MSVLEGTCFTVGFCDFFSRRAFLKPKSNQAIPAIRGIIVSSSPAARKRVGESVMYMSTTRVTGNRKKVSEADLHLVQVGYSSVSADSFSGDLEIEWRMSVSACTFWRR